MLTLDRPYVKICFTLKLANCGANDLLLAAETLTA